MPFVHLLSQCSPLTSAAPTVYHEADPVAFTLNAAVDARYAKLIKPVAIPSSTQSLLTNVSNAYHRVSRMFDVSSLWGGGGGNSASAAKQAEPDEKDAKEQAEKTEDAQAEVAAQGKAAAAAATVEGAGAAPSKVKVSAGATAKATRPPGMKRMPSERPRFGMGRDEFEWVGRAEKRMRALNPSCTIDHYLPAEGLNA